MLLNKSELKKDKTNDSKSIFSILQKYHFNKINHNIKLNHRNSVLLRLSKNIYNKNNSFRNFLTQKTGKYSTKTIDYTPIKKRKTNDLIKNESSKEKLSIEPQNKIKNSYKFLSCKKLTNHLPKIIKPNKLILTKNISNSEFSLNNIENSNIIPLMLPNIGTITKRENKRHILTNFALKNIRIINK